MRWKPLKAFWQCTRTWVDACAFKSHTLIPAIPDSYLQRLIAFWDEGTNLYSSPAVAPPWVQSRETGSWAVRLSTALAFKGDRMGNEPQSQEVCPAETKARPPYPHLPAHSASHIQLRVQLSKHLRWTKHTVDTVLSIMWTLPKQISGSLQRHPAPWLSVSAFFGVSQSRKLYCASSGLLQGIPFSKLMCFSLLSCRDHLSNLCLGRVAPCMPIIILISHTFCRAQRS